MEGQSDPNQLPGTTAKVGLTPPDDTLPSPGGMVDVDKAMGVLPSPGGMVDVDKAMGVLPSAGPSKGMIIIGGKQMSYEEAKKMGVDPSGAESKGIVIVDGKPMSLSDAAAKGIVVVDTKPGGLPSPWASKGTITAPSSMGTLVAPTGKAGVTTPVDMPAAKAIGPSCAKTLVNPGTPEVKGLNRGPATEALQGLGRTYGTPIAEPPNRPK